MELRMSDSKKEINLKMSTTHQSIYCDHLFRFALGPTISKLEFGVLIEDDKGDDEVPEITTTLLIPTLNLLEVLPFVLEQRKTDETKAELLNKLHKLIDKLENL